MNIDDKPAIKVIERAAEELKKIKEMKAPEWSRFVKTGVAKERPPVNRDWWYTRTASVLRRLYKVKAPIGVSKLRKKYSSRKNRGFKPERVYRGSGKIIRSMLQQLEKINFIEQKKVKGRKGRILTKKGRSFLDKVAKNV